MNRNSLTLGFTLIETLVALVLGITILTIALSVMSTTVRSKSEVRVRQELALEGQFIHLQLQQALRATGVGIPRASNIETDDWFDSSVIVAAANGVGIVGDMARPHASYNTFGTLHPEAGGDRRHLAWHTENNGSCMPDSEVLIQGSAVAACSTADTSVWFPGNAAECSGGAGYTVRTCPWGLKRIEGEDRYVLASGSGAWTTGSFTNSGIDKVGNTWFVDLDTSWDDTLGNQWPGTRSGGQADSAPFSTPGTGFVATPDRAFFVVESGSTNLLRRQCWGDPKPADPANASFSADWPDDSVAIATLATGTFDPTQVLNNDGSNHECTPWERLSSNVSSASFTYWDDTGVATAVKGDIVRVDYYIVLAKTLPSGPTVQYPVIGSVPIRNSGKSTAAAGAGSGGGGGPPPGGGGGDD